MPNYNLKTRYTVIPRYNVGNIPKLIFFDTAQRYVHIVYSICTVHTDGLYTYVHVIIHKYVHTCQRSVNLEGL